MNHLDILIYGAIAAFLLFRLWSVLGQRNENDENQPQRPNPFERVRDKEAGDDENVVVLEGRARPAPLVPVTARSHAPDSLAGTIDKMKLLDPSFDEKGFIEGAKQAFRQIVEGFTSGDLSRVAWLLGPNVRTPFEAGIASRQAAGETLLNRIERMDAADIVAAKIVDDVASLTVEFVCHQSHISLQSGESEKDKSWPRAEETRDIWTFRRDLKSTDPNWLLVETRT